jgi:hypothetical protein
VYGEGERDAGEETKATTQCSGHGESVRGRCAVNQPVLQKPQQVRSNDPVAIFSSIVRSSCWMMPFFLDFPSLLFTFLPDVFF